ncbi:glycoside hydrolase family 6 protein [Nonomuraea sp. NPDC049725]|uniref:glycoside hydrolase family 6 protein n=1 Tax=Nonomuraea sp. NPDC049725 TaxID=3154508 RepID=UPI003417E2C3
MSVAALRDGDPRHAGPYTLLGRLGEGGMGAVYLGADPAGGRVAVKLIHPGLDADPGFRRRFAREVAAARRVARFCTAPVLDADVTGDPAYIVTEYVEGPSLDEAVRRSGPLTGSALDGLAAATATALRAIHGAGVVHRDLKPSNVLLSQVGPKVIDFGIAQLGGADLSSAVVGTPAYMSPEQVRGGPVGPASDVFAWGCVVAFAATGASPFAGESVPAILYRIVHEPPVLPPLPEPLRELVAAALSRDPADRPTAQALLDRLSSGASGEDPQEPVRDGPAAGGERTATGRRLTIGVAALAAAVAVTTAVVALRPGDEAAPVGVNPLRAAEDVRLFAPPEPDAAREALFLAAADRPEDAALMRALATVPHAIRLAGDDAVATVATAVEEAERAGGVPVFVIDHLPGGDCAPGGAENVAAYQSWIKGIAGQLGSAEAVVILEPASLVKIPGTAACDLPGSPSRRYHDLATAVRELKRGGRTAVYLDGGHEDWPATAEIAQSLVGAGVTAADGFFLNAQGYQPTAGLVAYGRKLSTCVAVLAATGRTGCPADVTVDAADLPHFVIDTSRNGRGPWVPEGKAAELPDPQPWCNPPGRGAGARPTTRTGDELVDAYLWINRAGTSSGRCRRGAGGEEDPLRGEESPVGGSWWPELALERAALAVPPLR